VADLLRARPSGRAPPASGESSANLGSEKGGDAHFRAIEYFFL
jgi:hypothetical protein